MKNIIIFLLSLLIFEINFAQRIQIEVGITGTSPLNKDLKSTYDFGKGIVFQPNIGFLKNRLRIGPSLMFTNFRNHYSIGAITSMNMKSIGAVLGYTCFENGKTRVVPFVKWHRTSYEDIIGPAKDYYGNIETLVTGKGNMWSGGIKFIFNFFYMEAGAHIYKPLSIASDFIIKEANNGYEIYHLYDFMPAKLNFNQMYCTIGFTLPDKIHIEPKIKSPNPTN